MANGDFQKFLVWGIVLSIPAGIASVTFPLYLQGLGISYAEIGAIFAIGPVLGLVLNYFVGTHSDAVGRKAYLVLSSVLFSAYFIAIAFFTKSWEFTIASLLWSSYLAISSASSGAYLSDIMPKNKRGQLAGRYNGIAGMAVVAAMALGGVLLLWLGYRNLFLVCALFGMFSVLLAMGFRETVKKPKPKSGGRPSGISKAFDFGSIPWKIKFLFLVLLISNIAGQTITAFGFPLYFKHLGADAGLIGFLIGFMWCGYYLSQLFFGKFADRFHPGLLYASTFALIIPVNVFLVFNQSPFAAAGVLFLQAAAFGLGSTAVTKMIFDSAGKNNGRDIAFVTNNAFIASVIGSFSGGLIMEHLGFSWIFAVRVVLFIICALLMICFARKFQKSA
ncbi:MAG: MFS transporter [Candidatus Aenigmarchaeota archaeon]|nr:MFS transporter [Candidatus Aenigmarchaeota archaeon]